MENTINKTRVNMIVQELQNCSVEELKILFKITNILIKGHEGKTKMSQKTYDKIMHILDDIPED